MTLVTRWSRTFLRARAGGVSGKWRHKRHKRHEASFSEAADGRDASGAYSGSPYPRAQGREPETLPLMTLPPEDDYFGCGES